MQTSVSARGQTVVPKAVRTALGITPVTRLRRKLRDKVVVVSTDSLDSLEASVGILRGKMTFDDLIRDRDDERAACTSADTRPEKRRLVD